MARVGGIGLRASRPFGREELGVADRRARPVGETQHQGLVGIGEGPPGPAVDVQQPRDGGAITGNRDHDLRHGPVGGPGLHVVRG